MGKLTIEDVIEKGMGLPDADDLEEIQADLEKSKDAYNGLPKDVVAWLKGEQAEVPASIDKVSDQLERKINMSMALLVVNRLTSMNTMIKYQASVEASLLEDADADIPFSVRMGYYQQFNKNISSFMDFARKFTQQNSEVLEKEQPVDELADLLRNVEPSLLRKLTEIIKEKGAALTEDDYSGLVSKSDVDFLE